MSEVKLNDLRRYAILNRTPITYSDASGRQARVRRNGVVEIPGLAGAPPYNIEDVLADAQEFVLEPEHPKAQIRRLSRPEIAALLAISSPFGVAPKEHEE